ncbi:tyrosine-type recombinase/integrase [Methylomagnum sp.]
MPLTDPACRNAKPKDKSYRLADEKGLYLEVMPNGSKYFRLKYRFDGKEKRLAFGVYPEVTLKEARPKRDKARALLSQGVDPSAQRKATKHAQAESFESITREWLTKFGPSWTAEHAERITRRFERNVFPWIGARPIRQVTAPELLAVLRRIEERGALDTAHRAHQNCGQVFRYAVATGRAERDPSGDLRGALPPVNDKHHASITDPKAIGALLRANALAVGGGRGTRSRFPARRYPGRILDSGSGS